jgi:hypothetical protein
MSIKPIRAEVSEQVQSITFLQIVKYFDIQQWPMLLPADVLKLTGSTSSDYIMKSPNVRVDYSFALMLT